MTNNVKRILLVEDNEGDAFLACERLAEAPGDQVQVDVVKSLAEAVHILGSSSVDAILLDLNLPDSSGLDTLRRVKAVARQAPVIAVSGQFDENMRRAALAEGAEEVFGKDETNSRLFCRSVLYVIERNRARMQHHLLKGLLDATPDAILVANASGHVRFVNAAAIELFDCTEEELFAETLSFSAQHGEPVQITIYRQRSLRRCELRLVHLEWDGEPVQLASIRDMTEQMEAEALRERSDDLERQNQRMQEANRLKTEFLANMSHEIRTPMNAIIGMSYLLDKTRLDAEQHGFLSKIKIASRSLLGVINDVLDLSKIEAGEVALEQLPFDLPKLLRELGQMLQDQAMSKGVYLLVHQSAGAVRRVCGDVTRVRQILTNLLGNAIKFTEQGQVELTVTSTVLDGQTPALRFDIRDTGIGIAPADLDRLFKPFTQADASTTRRFGGTGLGLSIVHQLTHLMGGRVDVTSQLGRGSVFSVTLPLASVSDEQGGAEGSPQTLEVLVSVKGKGQLQGLRSMVGSLGWHLESVELGAQALPQLAERLSRGQVPDVWIVDAAENDSPSAQALAALRQKVDDAQWPPCVALCVADAVPTAIEHMADACLRQPLSTASLFESVLEAMMQRHQQTDRLMQQTQLDAVGVQWLSGVRLLIVDDSPVNLEVSGHLLEREGASVELFNNAGSALKRLKADATDIDAVLMDVQMPGMDGNAATRVIRGELGLTALPVIALSAGAFVSERGRAIDAGMVDFVSKPVDPDTLIRTVRLHVERARGMPLKIERRTEDEEPAETAAWPHIEGIDSLDVSKRLKNDVELFVTMLTSLLREFGPGGSATIALALGKEDGRALFAARMHKLRGSAGMLGASAILRLAKQADEAARQGASAAQLESRLSELTKQLAQLAEHARPLLEAQATARAATPTQTAMPINMGDLEKMVSLLQTQDFGALKFFNTIQPTLRAALEPAQFGCLQEAVERLEFARAAACLLPLLDKLQPADHMTVDATLSEFDFSSQHN